MGLYKRILNVIPGTSLVPTNTAIRMRDAVATQSLLPLTGNVIGDGRVTTDTGHLYLWSVDSLTGILSDWIDQGNFIDVSWDSLSGKPSSAVSNIDDAVSKRHTQGTDQGLEIGGIKETTASQVKTAVSNSHAPHSDDQDLSGKVDKISGSSLVPDTEIAKIHTQNSDTKLAEGTTNEVTASNAKSAVDLKHTQGTDQGLDTGGLNAVTAAQAKTAYTHSQTAHAPSDAVSLATVKGDTDIADAISKKHAAHSDDQDLSGLLKLDQSSPQSIVNGKPTVQGFQFNTDPTVDSFSEGKLYYDKLWKTLSLNIDSDVSLQIGQETLAYCYNNSGISIINGDVVYISGAYNGYPTIALADATNESKSFVLGVCTTSSIAHGSYGHITIRGHVNNLNTASWAVGTSLYLSDVIPGALTSTAPTSGNFDVRVGRVMVQDSSVGRVYVNVRQMTKLTDLGDVTITSPSTDEVLKYNGTEWVNASASSVGAGKGVEFFLDGTDILPTGVNNSNKLETMSKTPWAAAESVETTVVNNNTVFSDGYLYNNPLNRTSLQAGVWTFLIYCGVDNTQGTTEILGNIMRVRPGDGTVTITGTVGTTTRTVNASSGTPFATSMINVGGTIDSDSYLQTPQGLYRILSRISDTQITISVPSTYTNESSVSFSVHKRLFQITTGDINNTATSPLYAGLQLYSTTSVQPAYPLLVTDRIAAYRFSKTTRTSNVNVYFSYGGTTRYSHIETPLNTLHGDLAGLQGGTGSVPNEQYYHLTQAELTAVGTISGKEDVSNKSTSNTLGTSDTLYPSQKAVKEYVDNLGITDIALNVMLNAFRIAQIGSLTIFQMIKGIMDEYEDESGIDTVNSLNETYNSSDDYYQPYTDNDSYTKLLLHLDNNVTDSETSPKTVTNNNVTFSSSTKKFGTHSAVFNGSSSYLSIPDSDDFNFGSSEFTIDFWINFNSFRVSSDVLMSQVGDGNNLMRFFVETSGTRVEFDFFSGGTQIINLDSGVSSLSLQTGQWYHFAVIRGWNGNVNDWAITINGIAVATKTDSDAAPNYSAPFIIGCMDGYISTTDIDGYVDEVRISKGVARWTSNFTPSSSEYGRENMTLISNTQIATIIPTSARVVLFEQDVDSITLNTDLKAYVSRDGGTTFTQITLEDEGNYITGARVLTGVVDISSQPSGSNMKYKIESLNRKNLKIHGTAVSWK